MKAALLTGIRQMEIRNLPEPNIKNDNDVLLKIEKVGVCGSDVHYYETGKIGSQVVKYPFIVGHECAATVKSVGPAVKIVKVGDRVVVEPAISCNNCDQCRQHRENTCRNLKFLGCPGQIAGCLCEYLVMPEQCCLPVGNKITLEQGVLCEPLAIGVYTVKQANLPPDAAVAVLVAGPIGLSCLLAAKSQGINSCYVTDKIDARVEIALNGGAVWSVNPNKQDIVKEIISRQSGGMDAVFECAGQQDAIDQAIELLKPGGKLMLIGIPREERISFIIDKTRRKEITIVNVRRQNHCTQKCIDLLASGKIRADFMITHRFSFDQTRQAFDLVAQYRDGVVKALIEF